MSLVVALLACCMMAALALPAAAQDIESDPFVQQEIDRSHWEPGGKYWPSSFSDRGSIVQRGGQVLVTPTTSYKTGNLLHQGALIHGSYTYTIDLASWHPYWVHSPFDVTHSDSGSASTSTLTKEVDIDLNWDALYHHPANGYDGVQGGGYPPPTYARDEFSFDITGTAQGQYVLSSQQQQAYDVPPLGRNVSQPSFPTVPSSVLPPAPGEIRWPEDGASSQVGVWRSESVNPSPNQSSNDLQRFGQQQPAPTAGELIGEAAEDVAWSTAEEVAEEVIGEAGGPLVKGAKYAPILVDLTTEEDKEKFGKSFNEVVRSGIKDLAGGLVKWGITAGGTAAGAAGGAAVTAPSGPGAVGGAIVGGTLAFVKAHALGILAGAGTSFVTGKVYDALGGNEFMTNVGEWTYETFIQEGSVVSRAQDVASSLWRNAVF